MFQYSSGLILVCIIGAIVSSEALYTLASGWPRYHGFSVSNVVDNDVDHGV